jgi:uncharacterized protein (DUF302 family)
MTVPGGAADSGRSGAVTKRSPRSVADTVSRLLGMLDGRAIKVFAVIDQRAEAQQVGLELRETVLVVFGNPAGGTPVMESAPLAALDLPLKTLVWADSGQTYVSYLPSGELAARYELAPELAAKLALVEELSDELVAP